MKKLIVFTDLDGTLLAHDDYSCEEALPAIQLLLAHDFPLIINSSKTYAEVSELTDRLGIPCPYVVENGSVIILPPGQLGNNTSISQLISCGVSYEILISDLKQLRKKHGYRFSGFSDYTVDEIASLTGLDNREAALAKQRHASEPVNWHDDELSLQHFSKEIGKLNYKLTRGGRFYHVMGNCDKGTAVTWLLDRYRREYSSIQWVSAALGDSMNDIPMLQQVDFPLLIKNPATRQQDLDLPGNTIISQHSAGRGWNEVIHELIEKL